MKSIILVLLLNFLIVSTVHGKDDVMQTYTFISEELKKGNTGSVIDYFAKEAQSSEKNFRDMHELTRDFKTPSIIVIVRDDMRMYLESAARSYRLAAEVAKRDDKYKAEYFLAEASRVEGLITQHCSE